MKRGTWQAWLCATSMLFGACSSTDSSNKGNNTNAVLTRVTDAGAKCPAGGVLIETGADSNGSGVLDDAEVTQSKPVCNGAATPGMTGQSGQAGHNTLVSTTTLPVGDTSCVGGGTKIETGLDDGKGGGTADDGLLQAGEVSNTQYVCNGQQFFPGTTTQPAEPPGASKIITTGGNSTNGSGGEGGYVQLEAAFGTLGGHLKIFSNGVAITSFTLPTPAFSAGPTPFVVAASTVLKTYATQAAGIASTDVYFQVNNDSTLYKNVATVATPVSGIDIAAGATLTFALNFNNQAIVSLGRDLRNAGTIKTALRADAKSAGALSLSMSSFQGATGSSIALDGLPGTASAGGAGGYLDLAFNGSLVNQGAIHNNGGNGDSGGGGGSVYLHTNDGGIYNTGPIDSRGGTGAVTGGGDAGSVQLYSGYRTLHNSGALTTTGGDGVTTGGNGGYLDLEINNVGSVVNSGAFNSYGGLCSATNCTGGDGGYTQFYAYGGDILNSAAIDTHGADGKGTGNGGSGGYLDAEIYDYNSNFNGNIDLPAGSLRISGNITTKGGNGAVGGTGGYVYTYLYPRNAPQGQEIALLGYTDLVLSGGSAAGGTNTGGNAGYLSVRHNRQSYLAGGRYYGPSGAAINYAKVTAKGGDGPNGGSGGDFTLSTQSSYYFNNPFEFAANHGALEASGGASSAVGGGGGSAGNINVTGAIGVTNRGAITARGGSATGANASGSSGNQVYFGSDHGPTTNTAAIDLSGGTGLGALGNGGSGGSLYLVGDGVNNSAAVTCGGGNATTNGGDGGYVQLFSSPSGPSVNTGTFGLAPGTGTTPGQKGLIEIDGSNVTP